MKFPLFSALVTTLSVTAIALYLLFGRPGPAGELDGLRQQEELRGPRRTAGRT